MGRPRRGQGGGKAKASKNTSNQGRLPDVYAEMLTDAFSSPAQVNEEGKTIKKRRIAGRIIGQGGGKLVDQKSEQLQMVGDNTDVEGHKTGSKPVNQQILDRSEDSEMSDADWEDVDLAMQTFHQRKPLEHDYSSNGELNLVLGTDDHEARRSTRLRKPVTSADRKLRLEIHKMHLLCLLFHVHIRNYWCNDEKVHGLLKGILSNRTKSDLNQDENKSQFQKSRSFIDGLTQARATFREKFFISARGMTRPYWAESPEALASSNLPEDLELPMQLTDFRAAAEKLEASRDTGAQLFCALLRSAGVEVRLVCSLQPLPFTAATSQRTTLFADQGRRSAPSSDEGEGNTKDEASIAKSDGERKNISIGLPQRLDRSNSNQGTDFSKIRKFRLHLSHSYFLTNTGKTPTNPRESPYPVFWVEALSEADQKWITVDPLITPTVAKPSRLEPPGSDVQNNLTYVLAFEDDGFARDVTRRYAQAYNGKTRKGRVEATNEGAEWWRRVLGLWKRYYSLPRDQIEDSWLASKEAAEPMPRNILDFRDHPYFALERHLKRGEVIHPKREVGKVAAGRRGGVQILEPVFRRGDVQSVKSADKWFRIGREIKIGEQPLKRVSPRQRREPAPHDDESTEESARISLYAIHQTIVYTAPPVIRGRIPKNAYGNLDIYVPSMVPAGGTHITNPDTARAARILGIDYSDAVSGFTFKGRHATAVINGAVVASDFREAVQEVLYAFGDERAEEEEKRRSSEALRVWRRLLTGLRIRERIDGYEIEGERGALDENMGGYNEGDDDELGGVGFFPDRIAEGCAEPDIGLLGPDIGAAWQDDAGQSGFLTGFALEGIKSGFGNATENSTKQISNQQELGDYDGAEGGGFEEGMAENSERFTEQIMDPLGHPFGHPYGHKIEEAKYDGGHCVKETPRQGPAGAEETEKIPSPTQETQDGPLSLPTGNEDFHNAGNATNSFGFADLNLPISELAEATMLQQLHEAGRIKSPLREVDASPNLVIKSLVIPSPSQAAATGACSPDGTAPPAPKVAEIATDEYDSGSDDAGSLLSHDPEDEDADPEWLA